MDEDRNAGGAGRGARSPPVSTTTARRRRQLGIAGVRDGLGKWISLHTGGRFLWKNEAVGGASLAAFLQR
jgi:hypothetical protein